MEHLSTKRLVARFKDVDDPNVVGADLEEGWTEEQAQGLLDGLGLVGAVPNWKSEHLLRLYQWCASHGADHKTIEGQLEFVAYDLCSSYPGIGMALKQANTVEKAREAVEPYVKLLNAEDCETPKG
jgi:hypothetical protein